MIITACPTLTNPDLIDDVDTLRRELHAANEQIVGLAARNAEITGAFHEATKTISKLIAVHQIEPEKLSAAMDALIAWLHLSTRPATH